MASNAAPEFSPSSSSVPGEGATPLKRGNGRLLSRPRSVWQLAVVALVLGGVAWAADWLAQMPRERAQLGYNYRRRVIYGAEMAWRLLWLRLNAAPDPLAITKLPVLNLHISRQSLAELNAHLPESGQRAQSAQISIGSETLPATVKYNGISINHWGMPNKSWGVKLDQGNYHGMNGFNLVIPRAITQLENWLGNEMGRRLGILSPDSEFVHFRLNDKYDGVRLLQENFQMNFLKRRNLPLGKIFFGDITPQQIYNGVRREKLFSETAGWEAIAPDKGDTSLDEVSQVIRLIQNNKNPYSFYAGLSHVMDIESLLRYMALLEIVCSVHIDETHNWKLYLNPETKKLQPIVFNAVAYYWNNTRPLDIMSNQLFRAVLGIPGFRERKDQIIWEAIHGKLSTNELQGLVSSEVDRIRADMHAFAWKLAAGDKGIKLLSNSQWDQSIQDLLQTIRERNDYFVRELSTARASYNVKADGSTTFLLVSVPGRVGIELQDVVVKLNGRAGSGRASLTRIGLKDTLRADVSTVEPRVAEPSVKDIEKRFRMDAPVVDGKVTFSINDRLFSKRRTSDKVIPRIVSGDYVYRIEVPQGASFEVVERIGARHPFTHEIVPVILSAALPVSTEYHSNSVWWDPAKFSISP